MSVTLDRPPPGMTASIYFDKRENKEMKTAAMIEAAEHVRNRPRDVEALHHMWAARPLKPPPYNFGPARNRAALLAAREDRKNGVLV